MEEKLSSYDLMSSGTQKGGHEIEKVCFWEEIQQNCVSFLMCNNREDRSKKGQGILIFSFII